MSCIEWTKTKNNKGYGLIWYYKDDKRTSMSAHRYLYMQHHNILLNRDQVVMHMCDNPGCVNIEHLIIGSHKDNVWDKINKGRSNYNPSCTKLKRMRELSDEQVRNIRSACGSIAHIANTFGISQGYVSKLRNGKAKSLVL